MNLLTNTSHCLDEGAMLQSADVVTVLDSRRDTTTISTALSSTSSSCKRWRMAGRARAIFIFLGDVTVKFGGGVLFSVLLLHYP